MPDFKTDCITDPQMYWLYNCLENWLKDLLTLWLTQIYWLYNWLITDSQTSTQHAMLWCCFSLSLYISRISRTLIRGNLFHAARTDLRGRVPRVPSTFPLCWMFILIPRSARGAEGGSESVSVNRTKEKPLMGKIADRVHLLHWTYQEFPSVMPHTVTQEEDFTPTKENSLFRTRTQNPLCSTNNRDFY